MSMSMLQAMMRDHERQIANVRAELEDSRAAILDFQATHEATNKYFLEWFGALITREQARIDKLEASLAELEERPASAETRPLRQPQETRGNGQLAQVLSGEKRP